VRWPFVTRRERIRREAADWIALLSNSHDEEDRSAFEDWYRSDPARARAYDRASQWYGVARDARRPREATAAPRPRVAPRRISYAVAAAFACAALAAFILLSARTSLPGGGPARQIARFSAGSETTRRIVLEDGSQVVLSPGASIEVAIGPAERRLRLVSGEGRFSVAHEGRPFIVAAEGTEVVARGTRFVVRIGSGRTLVSLIEGQVDVTYPQSASPGGGRRVRRLSPGEQLVVGPTPQSKERASRPAAAAAGSTIAAPRAAMLQFDDTPLGEAIEQANRHAAPPIRLRDPTLAGLRLTGAFRAGDTPGFAQGVAAAFGLEVERGADGTLWLRARRSGRSGT